MNGFGGFDLEEDGIEQLLALLGEDDSGGLGDLGFLDSSMVEPRGFAERLGVAGGVPTPPVLEAPSTLGALGQGLLSGVSSFLNARAALGRQSFQGRQRLEQEKAKLAAQALKEKRSDLRSIRMELLRDLLRRSGDDVLAKHLDTILLRARDFGRQGGMDIGKALGIPEERLAGLLANVPEQGGEAERRKTRQVKFRGETFDIPEERFLEFLRLQESARKGARGEAEEEGVSAAGKRESDILSQIEDDARMIAMQVSGMGDAAFPEERQEMLPFFRAVQDSVRQRLIEDRRSRGLLPARPSTRAGPEARSAAPRPVQQPPRPPSRAVPPQAPTARPERTEAQLLEIVRQFGSPPAARVNIDRMQNLTPAEKKTAKRLIGKAFPRG